VRQMFRKGLLVAGLSGVLVTAAYGQEKVRIGLLNDQSGVFSTYQGIGSKRGLTGPLIQQPTLTLSGLAGTAMAFISRPTLLLLRQLIRASLAREGRPDHRSRPTPDL